MSFDLMSVAQLSKALEVIDLRLVTYRGCLIRKAVFDPESVDMWLAQTGGDLTAVESVVNHVHLYDVIQGDESFDLRELEDVAGRIAVLWREIVRVRQPELEVVVTYATEPDEYGPTLSLHVERGVP